MRPVARGAWPELLREHNNTTRPTTFRGPGAKVAGREKDNANENERSNAGKSAEADEYEDEVADAEGYDGVEGSEYENTSEFSGEREEELSEPGGLASGALGASIEAKKPIPASEKQPNSLQSQVQLRIQEEETQQRVLESQTTLELDSLYPRPKRLQNITISDDRSVGSEFELTRRILQVLKPKETKSLPSETEAEKDPAEKKPAEKVSSQPIPLLPNHSPSGQRTFKSPVLQSYHMELMRLEQQNKERNTMSKQGVRPATLGQSGMPVRMARPSTGDLGSSSDAVLTKDDMQSLPAQTSLDSKVSVQNKIEGSAPKSQPDLLSTEAIALGIPNVSTLNPESLQVYIQKLQGKAGELENLLKEQEPSRFQLIHRIINSPKFTSLFFDKPQWFIAEDDSMALKSSLPLSDISTFPDKHPDVSFVVYRDYYSTSVRFQKSDKSEAVPEVQHSEECIYTYAKDLTAGVTKFLRSMPEFLDDYTAFKSKGTPVAPYFIFYHSRHLVEEVLNGLNDKERRQFKLLYDYIMSEYSSVYQEVDSLLERGKITFKYIKYLFKPRDILVVGQGDDIRGVLATSWLEIAPEYDQPRGKSTQEERRVRWNISSSSWRFNGVFSHLIEMMHLDIDQNDDSEKNIECLNLRPLKFVGKQSDGRLRRRGEMFWKCRNRHFVSHHEDKGRDSHHSGDDRYMVDLKTYSELHPPDTTKYSYREEEYNDDLSAEDMEQDTPPNSNFVYLVPIKIKAYNLKQKRWVDLRVDCLSEVVWNKEAFKSLVLDNKTKNLIQALISNQLEAEKSTDLISGKGNGLILLLHGGPGTGKTLTAESVAEIAEKPLYPVTCGDIGTEPEKVEMYLESVLHLGKTWDCVVLLDEADVFLEQRSLADLQRNALVSVFLRVLEYHDGILILTSNRVGTFDEAFKSRIQLALHYANLSPYQREKIWRNFFERLRKLEVEKVDFDDLEDHLEHLSKIKMNGRQIRNAITTARQYAKWKAETLNYAMLKDIVETSGRFDVYLEKLNGGYSQDQLAEDEGIRLSETADLDCS